MQAPNKEFSQLVVKIAEFPSGFQESFFFFFLTVNEGNPDLIPGSVRSLEKRIATHSSILAWRIPWTKEFDELHTVHGDAKSQTCLSN